LDPEERNRHVKGSQIFSTGSRLQLHICYE
jgi:hypothetical protein